MLAEPGRQALAWSGLGMAGFGLAAIGLILLNRGGSGPIQAQAVAGTSVTATATLTATPSPTATLTPTAAATATPTAAPAKVPVRQDQPTSNSQPEATSPPATPTPTAPPVVAGGPYCPSISSTSPPNSVIGHFTINGELAPAGTSVSLAFDGVVGPTATTSEAGGYRVDYGAAGSDCANRVGAAIAVVYGGQFFATGHRVGDSPGAPVLFNVAAP